MKTLKAFQTGDGAHWGLTDWYPDKAKALEQALKSGKPFDTGWYSSKKEIASARIYTDINNPCPGIQAQVYVSDDFDTEGIGGASVTVATLEGVQKAISAAWDEAEINQKENRQYLGYLLRHYSKKGCSQCLDYYLVPAGGLDWIDSPPGDNYGHWGWQNDGSEGADAGNHCNEKGIPIKVVQKFEKLANAGKQGKWRVGNWEFESWKD